MLAIAGCRHLNFCANKPQAFWHSRNAKDEDDKNQSRDQSEKIKSKNARVYIVMRVMVNLLMGVAQAEEWGSSLLHRKNAGVGKVSPLLHFVGQ
jgi:hypothetical protein